MFGLMWKSVDCVIEPKDGKGGLYLGNIGAAEDIANLRKLGIKAVLTVAAASFLSYDKAEIPNHKIIPAQDFESFNLAYYFPEGIEFIEKNLEKTNVLVHCFAGVSRSSSMIIAFLMTKKKTNYYDTLAFVRAKRSCVYPNTGFAKQLLELEKQLKL